MLNFKELPDDGQAFEQLVRELLFSRGLHVQWSGVGPDGGRDLVCHEKLQGLFASETRVWLVQCKHYANSGKSVGIGDLDDIVDSCAQHGATGYLLACSTQPSSAVVSRLESITANPKNQITATFWDAVTLERMLSSPMQWAIAQRFLPNSAGEWRLYATEKPNDFVAHYKGYVFHLTNRIGSRGEHHLDSIALRIAELEKLKLPDEHFVRPRAVYYDDKGGSYTWYVDYMYPSGESPAAKKGVLLYQLRDGWGREDGQIYSWDLSFVRYSPLSDHYDADHYDYYTRYLPNFLMGAPRRVHGDGSAFEENYAVQQHIEALESAAEKKRNVAFDAMVAAFKKLPFLRVIRGINVQIEDVHRFERRFSLLDVVDKLGVGVDYLFSALVMFEVKDEARFHELLSKLPMDIDSHFRASRVYVYLPGGGLSKDEFPIFELKLSIHPARMVDRFSMRDDYDEYFREIAAAVGGFASL
ncbi:restriction endonuclease [Corallococcus coralloides]|uniref:restriction endonuclease n=1 Tax=Corallococcus coralloides TaxID=184914 RepID=UPI00384FA227